MRTIHAVVVDGSNRDGQELVRALIKLGLKRVEYFSTVTAAINAFESDRKAYCNGMVFVRETPPNSAIRLIRHIMEDVDLSALNVVLTTTNVDPTESLWAYSLGAIAHLHLPADSDKLEKIVSATKYRRFKTA